MSLILEVPGGERDYALQLVGAHEIVMARNGREGTEGVMCICYVEES